MSKIGKKPVIIPQDVSVEIDGRSLKVVGGKGTLSFSIPEGIHVQQEGNMIVVSPKMHLEETKPLFGLTRAIIANMIQGVREGFSKKLELSGVGYRAQLQGNTLVISVGFSHPVQITPPAGITFSVSENVITVSGIDKTLVGDTAAKIRAIRPPEPYKGKGIKYVGEHIRRKAGKAAKATTGAK
jgi:large subunit ribosomal protein L6